MQNVRRIENKNGSISWQIDYVDSNRRRVRKSYQTLKEAKTALAHFHTALAKGTYDDPRRYDSIRLNDLIKKYTEVYGQQKSFIVAKRFHLTTIKKYFNGDRLLKTIDYSDLQNFQQHLLNSDRWQHPRSEIKPRKLKPATVNRTLSCLRHMFKCALSWKLIAKNPFDDGASLQVKENNTVDRFLSRDEINRLLAASDDYLRDIIRAAILTGCRKSELLSMQWQQIDFEQGIITLPETKTGERQYIPMNDDLKKLLRQIRAKQQNRGIIHTHVFLWQNWKGEYQSIKCCKTAFIAACERAGLKYGRLHPDGVTFHVLRHTALSWIAKETKSLYLTQKIGRHKSPVTTQRYSHLTIDDLKQAAGSLDGLCAMD